MIGFLRSLLLFFGYPQMSKQKICQLNSDSYETLSFQWQNRGQATIQNQIVSFFYNIFYMNSNEPPFRYCYFRVRCLDMWGGDIQQVPGFASEDQAIITIKNKINYNSSYCGVIFKQDNGSFTAYLKNKILTNPSKSQGHWHRCQTIFYGKKITRWNQCMIQQNPNKSSIRFEYFLVQGLDMSLGTLQKFVVNSDVEAEQMLRDKLSYNDSLCGLIVKEWGSTKYTVHIKDMRRCNPSESKENHYCRTSLFVGQQI